MEIRPPGSVGLPVIHEAGLKTGAASAGRAEAQDLVEVRLRELVTPEVLELLGEIDAARGARDPELPETLLRQAVEATEGGRAAEALQALEQLIRVAPERGARAAVDEPRLAAIRSPFEAMLVRVTAGARAEAEHSVAAATQLGPHPALAVADRFIELGAYVYYVRAAEIGRALLERGPRRTIVPEGRNRPVRGAGALKALSTGVRRAPLLVLFGCWMLGGIASLATRGFENRGAFEFWAVGFLALAVAQFVVTIRNYRRR